MWHFLSVLIVLGAASIACALGGSVPPTTAPVQSTSAPVAVAPSPTVATVTTTGQTPQPSGSNCAPRTDWAVYTVVSGDTLASIARRTGSSIADLVVANCLPNSNVLFGGQQLRIPSASSGLPTPTSDLCPGNISWFFTFTAGAIDRLCPNPVQVLNAAGEDFEGGRMLWYAAESTASDQRPTIYVIYNDGDWETFVDVWDASQQDSDPSIVPPAGRFQPAGNFGKVWRENQTVRQRLGWAYEPKTSFTGHMQTVIAPNPRPSGYVDHWYMDHGKAGIVLRIYSVDMAPNKWEVAGKG